MLRPPLVSFHVVLSVCTATAAALAQVPAPVQPLPARVVHRSIAPPDPAAVLHASAPLFQFPDQRWNHGEGFVAGEGDADRGGWIDEDDGSGVTAADVHTSRAWQSHFWTSPVHPNSGQWIRRFVGRLRPAHIPLPTVHPLYGPIPAGQGPMLNGTYVDQGAFELFAPVSPPSPTSKIVVVVNNWQTTEMPPAIGGARHAWQIYEGFYSPDGLRRAEKGPVRSVANFLANDQDVDVLRPPLAAAIVANAPFHAASYWPIAAYQVQSLAGRQTTLNEQRNMQLRQAVLLLLQQPDPRNPLHPQWLTAQEVEQRVVVVFAGGSNGGLQSMFAGLRYPDRIHGIYSDVLNPSLQRMFGEHDLGHVFGQLAAIPGPGAGVGGSDYMHWGRHAWNQGRWIHDLSLLRRQVRGQNHRPSYFRVGDEDITSTGTDWVAVLAGGPWAPSGQSAPSTPPGWPSASKASWAVAKFGCHGTPHPTVDPFTGVLGYHADAVLHGLIGEAIANRSQQLAQSPRPEPAPVPSEDRTELGAGLDDPHEWALGRPGAPMQASGEQLAPDTTWFAAAQPGAAGTWLGHKESMLIRDQRLYVAGAEGVVSAFVVDLAPGARQRLVKVASTHDANGRPRSLGLSAFALAALPGGSGGWELVVGTRRHLYKLDPTTLAITAGPVELPWEIAQPHHLKIGDALPNDVHAGPELVFASLHGGLVFYRPDLTPIHEWPEPGIVDFVIGGGGVTILSHRGVVADVVFDANGTTAAPNARLTAASRPIPRRLREHVPPELQDPLQDAPCQGVPLDLELMRMNWTQLGAGYMTCAVGLWTGDEDGTAVRAYFPGSRLSLPFATNLPGGVDIATCSETATPVAVGDQPGDHLLVLGGDRLRLYGQTGALLAEKLLVVTTQPGNPYHPFARHASGLVVGELVDNAATGSSGSYTEEVVIATQSGALVWMHVNDVATATAALGPAHWVAVGAEDSHVQPRTNQTLSATWPMAQRAGDPAHLHLLDPRGAYWRVHASGVVRCLDREFTAVGARGWDDLGNRDAAGVHVPLSAAAAWQPRLQIAPSPLLPPGLSFADQIRPRPWCPIDVLNVVYERSGGPYLQHNWARADAPSSAFQGFVVHPWGGCVLSDAGGREVWSWAAGTQGLAPFWGDLVQGLRFPTTGASAWQAAGLWASTAHVAGGATADRVELHELRSFVPFTPLMTHQAIAAFPLANGSRALVLGCPGGRVRVLVPGAMGTVSTGHALGNVVAESGDFGYGGGALAVRQLPNGSLRIFFGTVYGHTPRPAGYASPGQGTLLDGERATGGLHAMTWVPGATGFTQPLARSLAPSATTRGGYGVVGLCVADLLPEASGPVVHELIATTLAGDVIVLNADTLTEIWRTHVPGAAGFFNSIRVADLDNDGRRELYVAGSYGLWRFVQPGENGP